MYMRVPVWALCCFALVVLSSPSDGGDHGTNIPADALRPPLTTRTGPFPRTFQLAANWRFHSGDDPSYARVDLDDSAWVTLDSLETLLPAECRTRLSWEGIGWFRLHLNIHADLQEKQLALVCLQSGAAEIFLDGKALQSVGEVGNALATERADLTLGRGKLIPFWFGPGADHVIAVRYSNHWALADVPDSDFTMGFGMALAEPDDAMESWIDAVHDFSSQRAFAILPLGFAVLHFLAFVFYRRLRGNLYYALFAVSVAGLIYAPFHGIAGGEPALHLYHSYLFKLSMVTTVIFGLRFLYGELLGSTPRFFRLHAGVGGVMLLLIPFVDQRFYYYYFLVAFLPQVMRILYTGFRQQAQGCRIVGLGWLIFAAGCVLQTLIDLGHVELEFVWFPYILGILALLVCMSAHLGRAMARTNRDLETQLAQVQQLSEEALVQERRAREEAVEREHLEAENALKTAQLQAARERQKVLDQLEETNVELRHTQAQLVQSAKMAALGKLVAGITHEINTPVGAIGSTADTLRRATARLKEVVGAASSAATPGAGRSLDVIEQSGRVIAEAAQRITGIVGNLRKFARLDEAELQVANLEDGLESALAVMGSQVGEEVSVVREYSGIDPVYCDPAQLNNVFMHLITNATQAMRGAGTITLTTLQDDGRVHVRISDTGPGMEPEQLERIFEFDFRATESTMRMGLGLAADYSIVQTHHGELSIESQPGAGTQVTVSLPRRQS
jgi:signal transduction histidine kinase